MRGEKPPAGWVNESDFEKQPIETEETPASAKPNQTPFDVLVFAPHPDDEVLGCAGVILQALAQKKRVGVVVLTNGDGFPRAASVITKKPQDQLATQDFLKLAAERQQQSLDGLKRLGVPRANLMFLGYPDSGLAEIYRTGGTDPFRQR